MLLPAMVFVTASGRSGGSGRADPCPEETIEETGDVAPGATA
jgi:hypothetical protein